jgi:Ran GTPase-activating protein (RanGAP) involved in mRNA processing and transport
MVNRTLRTLNLKGNILGDDGVFALVESLRDNEILRELNLGVNEIGPLGACAIADVLPTTNILNLNISKNFLGDEAIQHFADAITNQDLGCRLKYADFSSCRLNDRGVEYFFQEIE